MPLAKVGLCALLLLAPCSVDPDPSGATEESEGGESVAVAVVVVEPVPVGEDPEPPPPPDPNLVLEELRVHSRLMPSTMQRIRAIVANHERRSDVFAKLGGSSIASRAFLHCFARERHVDLAGRDELAPTIEHFRSGNAAGRDPFRRESLAAQKGWSLRQGLAGRPPRSIREVRAISPRYALAFFGGNDVQGRNPRTFAERLERLLSTLIARGVVPVIGATTPRGDDETMDVWARRFNRVSRGIARAWDVPYVDYYLALEELPGRGLASDGVHPNVLLDHGRGRGCIFTEEGLSRGMNMRNLRTLEALHRLHYAFDGEAPDEESEALFGTGTADSPLRIERVPHAARLDRSTLHSSLDGYACAAGEDAALTSGPEHVVRIRVEAPTSLWLSAFAADDSARVFLLGDAPEPETCREAGKTIEVELQPGVHHVAVEVAGDVDATFLIDRPI